MKKLLILGLLGLLFIGGMLHIQLVAQPKETAAEELSRNLQIAQKEAAKFPLTFNSEEELAKFLETYTPPRRNPQDKKPAKASITGIVTLDGKPLAGVLVGFSVKPSINPDGTMVGGGSYGINTNDDGEFLFRLSVGEYRVFVMPHLYNDPRKETFPKKFTAISTSPFVVTLKEGINDFTLDLKSGVDGDGTISLNPEQRKVPGKALITGIITLDGKPLPNISVSFSAKPKMGPLGIFGGTTHGYGINTDSDGEFLLRLPVDEYKGSIKPFLDDDPRKETFPKKYTESRTTPFSVTLKEEMTLELELVSAP